MTIRILRGDCRDTLTMLPDASAQTCITSPPYYNLRDYGDEDQIGREETPEAYVAEIVSVFTGVRRVLKQDGTLWLNLGDSYGPNKQLLGMPWRTAFALQAAGWVLRSAIVWHKPNPMPESVKDRPTQSYEMLFLFAATHQYFYNYDAIAETAIYEVISPGKLGKAGGIDRNDAPAAGGATSHTRKAAEGHTRNCRNVWTIAPTPCALAHFATMPPELVERCIKAGSSPGDVVLDPFGGAGTTGLVADRLGRNATLIELNSDYADMARNRISQDAGMFAEVCKQ